MNQGALGADYGLQGPTTLQAYVGLALEPYWPSGMHALPQARYFRYADVRFFVVHIGSSSSIYDRRPLNRTTGREFSRRGNAIAALPVVDQIEELMAALSLNKSLLAQIMRVSRPTIYEWFAGKQPKADNEDRLEALLDILARGSVSAAKPLNARFVRRALVPGMTPLIELLCEHQVDDRVVLTAIHQAREFEADAARKRRAREDRLHALGFEDLSREQRQEGLARNVALLEWPKE